MARGLGHLLEFGIFAQIFPQRRFGLLWGKPVGPSRPSPEMLGPWRMPPDQAPCPSDVAVAGHFDTFRSLHPSGRWCGTPLVAGSIGITSAITGTVARPAVAVLSLFFALCPLWCAVPRIVKSCADGGWSIETFARLV